MHYMMHEFRVYVLYVYFYIIYFISNKANLFIIVSQYLLTSCHYNHLWLLLNNNNNKRLLL